MGRGPLTNNYSLLTVLKGEVRVRIKTEIVSASSLQPAVSGQGDHRSVIGTESRRGKINRHPFLFRLLRHPLAQAAIGRHPAGQYDPAHPQFPCGAHGGSYKHINHRLLKTSRNVNLFSLPFFFAARAEIMPYGGLQPAEAKIERTLLHPRTGKGNCPGITVLGQLIDHLSSRVTQTHHLCHLIVSLSRRIVPRAAHIEVLAKTTNQIKKGMTAGGEQGDIGKGNIPSQKNSQQVSL